MSRRILIGLAVVGLAYLVLLTSSRAWAKATVPHAACPREGVLVQVDPDARILSLCRSGHEESAFRVALGRGGVDKRVEGDERSPRGRYALSRARRSSRYHLFLPVGYPTSVQARQGFTGSAIGVHGPHAFWAWLGPATTGTDWTLGCIALGTRADVERVARWVSDNDAQEIVIL